MSFNEHHVFSFAVILLIQATVDAVNIKISQDNLGDNNIVDKIGAKGDVGPPGPVGAKGEPGSNWKQCVWKRINTNDNGLIQNCYFTKNNDNTSLRVFYGGNLRISNCDRCCKRWYFTIDGAECSRPMAIDGVLYIWIGVGTQNIHRHRHIEGYCNKVPKGRIKVGFWVGNCEGYGDADASSGWNSVSRIVIEEVTASQH